MLDGHQLGRVVHRAIAVVIVANGAVEHVISQNPIERFPLRRHRLGGFGGDIHSSGYFRRASAHQLASYFDHASITALNGTELRVVADLRKLCAHSIY